MRNGGDTVEEYQLSLVGALSRWSQITPEKLRLFPADEGTVTITIKVPRTPEALAGPTPFGVRVVPREHPELSDVAEGTVAVTPFGELRAEMNPVTVRGRLSALLRFTVNDGAMRRSRSGWSARMTRTNSSSTGGSRRRRCRPGLSGRRY